MIKFTVKISKYDAVEQQVVKLLFAFFGSARHICNTIKQ